VVTSRPPFLSIVLPVLNEARLLGSCLENVRRSVGAEAEIIVVDGGSTDGTRAIAEPFADRLITARRGRASQMNAGAEVARGEVLWFLHADSTVPADSCAQIRTALRDARVGGGCFSLRYPRPQLIYRVSDSLGNFGVNLFGFALGDHGIFCRRDRFNRIGGYRNLPILEDADLYWRLHRQGTMRQVRAKIVSDPRAFEKHGRYRTTCVYFVILALYVLGLPIPFLNRIYRRFVRIESKSCRPVAVAPAMR
jgi:rSAM/selenodomain-associated transferase 2